MEKIIIDFCVNLNKIIEQTKFETIDDYPKIIDSMINEKFIHEQIQKDISGYGINEELREMVKESLKRIIKLIGGESAKNGKKSRTIQKNCSKNKKNKC